jgi:hypothetical protein
MFSRVVPGIALVVFLGAHELSAVSTSVVISQVYGGGGNIGSFYRNDFIELHNRGTNAVSLSGWSVQYADSTNWQITALGSATLQPGQFFLVEQAQGPAGSANLPPPNASSSINLGAAAGKVALVGNLNLLSGTCPSGGAIVDFVGYGSANCAEGSAASAPGNTTAVLRGSSGCADTDNNAADFSVGAPTPRNTGSTFALCQIPRPFFTSLSRPSNGVFTVQFMADPAKTNTLQFSTNLSTWLNLTAALNQAGTLFTVTDTNALANRFYRVCSQ